MNSSPKTSNSRNPSLDNARGFDEAVDEIGNFHPVRMIAIVLFLFIAIALWTNWYTASVSLPRYCQNPAQTIQYLRKVITEERPAGEQSRRPYLIAAKLIFLLPRQPEESLDNYIYRVRVLIEEQCR